MELPILVYRCPGVHTCPGGSFDTHMVASKLELDASKGAGWFETLPEAIEASKAPKEVPAEAPHAPREGLEVRARELGIKFDGRTTDRRLSALIEEAQRG